MSTSCPADGCPATPCSVALGRVGAAASVPTRLWRPAGPCPPPAATPSPPAWPSAPGTGVLTGDRRSRHLALCERQLPPRRHLLGSCGVRVAPGEDVADRCGRVREPPQVVAGATGVSGPLPAAPRGRRGHRTPAALTPDPRPQHPLSPPPPLARAAVTCQSREHRSRHRGLATELRAVAVSAHGKIPEWSVNWLNVGPKGKEEFLLVHAQDFPRRPFVRRAVPAGSTPCHASGPPRGPRVRPGAVLAEGSWTEALGGPRATGG